MLNGSHSYLPTDRNPGQVAGRAQGWWEVCHIQRGSGALMQPISLSSTAAAAAAAASSYTPTSMAIGHATDSAISGEGPCSGGRAQGLWREGPGLAGVLHSFEGLPMSLAVVVRDEEVAIVPTIVVAVLDPDELALVPFSDGAGGQNGGRRTARGWGRTDRWTSTSGRTDGWTNGRQPYPTFVQKTFNRRSTNGCRTPANRT